MSFHSVIAPIPMELSTELYSGQEFNDLTNIPTSKILAYRPNDGVLNNFLDNSDVFGSQGMFVHESVHCREDVSWCCR